MGTSYPGSPPGSGFDDFSVPSNPEGTPLAEAGSTTRNHPEWHGDAGDAIEALQHMAAQRTHDHSGDATDVVKGAKLTQANTHQSPDTNTGPTSLHHTLGTSANQAMAGNYDFDWNSTTSPKILHRPYVICTSTTRPTSPFPGLMVFETNTNFLLIWANMGDGFAWQVIPFLQVPTVQLQQTTPQTLGSSEDWIHLLWDDVVNDTANFFNSAVDATQLIVENAGLYATNLAVQFDPDIAPNVASVAMFVNGALSSIQSNVFLRGENYVPGFSQTISAQGPIRLDSGDVLSGAVSYVASQGLGVVNTFVDETNNLLSRIGLTFLGV